MWVLALALGGILAYVMYSYLGAFVLGLFVYYITRPVHRRLSDRVPTSSLAAVVSLLTIALPIILLIAYTVAVGVSQLSSLIGPEQVSQVLGPLLSGVGTGTGAGAGAGAGAGVGSPGALLSQAISDPRAFAASLTTGSVSGTIQQAGSVTLSVLGVLGTGFIQLFIVLTLAFYLLRDDERLAGWTREQLLGKGTPADTYFSTVDRDLKTVFFGNILNAMAVAILAVICYVLLNVFAPGGVAIPSPVLVGLLVGVGSLIPVVGMKLVYVPVALIIVAAALAGNAAALWFPAVFLGVSLFVVDTFPDLLLRPYVSGRDIHTGATIVAYIIGPLLFGWYGLFLGPLLLVAMIHFARIVLPELAHGTPLTGAASTEGPLDPTDEEDEAPEPDPVDAGPEGSTDTGTDTDADGDGSPASDGGRVDKGGEEGERDGDTTTASASSEPAATEGRADSSADRVRSTWDGDEDPSAIDGGQTEGTGQ
jgi:predicted PurR-regulated permease PerM